MRARLDDQAKRRRGTVLRGLVACGLLAGAVALPRPAGADEERSPEVAQSEAGPKYTTHSLRGRVVWLAEAMQRLFDVAIDPDVEHAAVALETPEGTLHPIAKDGRGRGFHLDPRLREIDMELLVRQYDGSPLVQVITVYTLKPEGKFEFDYWCDICAIPMYELKPCECCQQEIRIRERPID